MAVYQRALVHRVAMQINDGGKRVSEANPLDRLVMQTLPDRVYTLETQYGGLRSAARATGVDAGYLKRLRDGEKTNPSAATLAKLGLRKEVIYVLQRQ